MNFRNMTQYSQTCRSLTSANNVSKKRSFKKCSLGLLVVVFVATLGFYLVEVNGIAARGFQIQNLESQIYTAREENQKLQGQLVGLKSMTDLKQRVDQLNMVAADKVTYYDVAGQIVAQR